MAYNIDTDWDYTTVDAAPVTLGNTTYQVRVQRFNNGNEEVHLTGPRGAEYFLRGYMGEDTGKRQVISWKSGQPLRVKGNEVKVIYIAGIIEVAV